MTDHVMKAEQPSAQEEPLHPPGQGAKPTHTRKRGCGCLIQFYDDGGGLTAPCVGHGLVTISNLFMHAGQVINSMGSKLAADAAALVQQQEAAEVARISRLAGLKKV